MTRVEYAHWTKQAFFVARQLAPAHLVDEMAAEAVASLATSLRTFDLAKQVSLGAYVLQKMRWAILDALRVWRGGSRLDTAQAARDLARVRELAKKTTTPDGTPPDDPDELELWRLLGLG
jgi:DNA-directed RNA polymerase specialized sigma subunit